MLLWVAVEDSGLPRCVSCVAHETSEDDRICGKRGSFLRVWKKKKKKTPFALQGWQNTSFLISGSLTLLCWGEPSSNIKPRAGSSVTLSSPNTSPSSLYKFLSSALSAPVDQRKRSYELSPSFANLSGPSSLEVSLFGNPFITSSPCFFSSLHNLFTPGEFCLCLWASLFLFHSQNPFWDSISVHPSLQLTSVQAGRVISPSSWRWQLWLCPASSDVFCFPRWSRKPAYLELAWCCLCCCQGALLPKPRLEKMGHLAKMSLYYLSISFSKSRVLAYVWCVLSLVRLWHPWTVACKPPLSVGFPRQEYWSGLPFPPPGDLRYPGIKPGSPALQVDSLPLGHLGRP